MVSFGLLGYIVFHGSSKKYDNNKRNKNIPSIVYSRKSHHLNKAR